MAQQKPTAPQVVQASVPETEIGKNVTVAVEGTILTITIDTAQRHGVTGSDNPRIASTMGNVSVPGTRMKLGLNLYELK